MGASRRGGCGERVRDRDRPALRSSRARGGARESSRDLDLDGERDLERDFERDRERDGDLDLDRVGLLFAAKGGSAHFPKGKRAFSRQ